MNFPVFKQLRSVSLPIRHLNLLIFIKLQQKRGRYFLRKSVYRGHTNKICIQVSDFHDFVTADGDPIRAGTVGITVVSEIEISLNLYIFSCILIASWICRLPRRMKNAIDM